MFILCVYYTHADTRTLKAVLNYKWIFPAHKSRRKFAVTAPNNLALLTLAGGRRHPGCAAPTAQPGLPVSHPVPKTFAAEVRAGAAAAPGNSSGVLAVTER